MKKLRNTKTIAAALSCLLLLLSLAPKAFAAVDDTQQYALTLEEAGKGGSAVEVEVGESFTLELTLSRTDIDPTGTQLINSLQDEIQYSTDIFNLEAVDILADGFAVAYRNMSNGVDRKIVVVLNAQNDGKSIIPHEYPAVQPVARITFTALKNATTEILQVNQIVIKDGYNVYASTVNNVAVTISDKEQEAHAITVAKLTGGTITTSPSGEAAEGQTVTLGITLTGGYTLSRWTVMAGDGTAVDVQGRSLVSGASFVMPAQAVTVTAALNAPRTDPDDSSGGYSDDYAPPQISIDETQTPRVAADIPRFDDVPKDHWAYAQVEYLAELGFVSGKSANLFYPNDSITRGEFIAILARMSGETLPEYDGRFHDVDASLYYAKPVAWAIKAGVTVGTSETAFSPNEQIKRQDIAVMIARYAAYRGYGFGTTNEAVTFTDNARISPYAAEAVRSMQRSNIINGYEDGSFRPDGNATRAESAKMLALVHHAMFPELLAEDPEGAA